MSEKNNYVYVLTAEFIPEVYVTFNKNLVIKRAKELIEHYSDNYELAIPYAKTLIGSTVDTSMSEYILLAPTVGSQNDNNFEPLEIRIIKAKVM